MRNAFFVMIVLAVIGVLAGWWFASRNVAFDDRVDAAFADIDCPERVRDFPGGYYTGPLWDTHIHVASIPDGPLGGELAALGARGQPVLGGNITIDEIACQFATEGTEKVFAFFPVWKEMAEPMVDVVDRTMERYPEQFVPFIIPPDHDDSPDGSGTVNAATLQAMLAIAPGLFDGYGEIGLYARDGGAPELPPDDPRMQGIYPLLVENNLIVYVHLGRGHQDNLERAADLYPNVTFIFHGDQLVVYGEEGRQDLSGIDEILANHPNVYYGVDELYGDDFLLRPEVSKEQFLAHFEAYEPLLDEDIATWKNFILRHPDQVMWGTDRGAQILWSMDEDVGFRLTDYARAFIGRLPESVQERFAYRNAQGLLE